MFLVFSSASGINWQIPASGINKEEANISAYCSTLFLLCPGLHLCGVGFSSINKWYNSWAIVKCCLPRGWLELISIKRCPELSFKHIPEKFSDRGLKIVSTFNFRSRLFNVIGSDELSPLSVRNSETCLSIINLFNFILGYSFHFKV